MRLPAHSAANQFCMMLTTVDQQIGKLTGLEVKKIIKYKESSEYLLRVAESVKSLINLYLAKIACIFVH
jgi:ABC-type uncharacterized transport system substrate-binding protein